MIRASCHRVSVRAKKLGTRPRALHPTTRVLQNREGVEYHQRLIIHTGSPAITEAI